MPAADVATRLRLAGGARRRRVIREEDAARQQAIAEAEQGWTWARKAGAVGLGRAQYYCGRDEASCTRAELLGRQAAFEAERLTARLAAKVL